jgi:RND family efflux transporter MFP subunit
METTHKPEMAPKSGKSNLALVVGAIVLVLLFGAGLIPKLHAQEKLTKQAVATSTEIPEVELTKGKLVAADTLSLPGNIEAISDTSIQARTSGYVSKMYVDIGSKVKAGQVVADIESPDVDQQLFQAQADTAKSRATVDQSQADVARLRAGVSQSEADLARQRANIKQAQAALAGSKAKYLAAESQESSSEAALAQAQQGVALQKANLAQAAAQYDLADTTEKRYRELLRKGFVAQQDYDQAASGLKTASANVDAVKANISASEANVRSARQAVESAKQLVVSAATDTDAAAASVTASQAAYESQGDTVAAAKEYVNAGQSTVTANRAQVTSSNANARRYSVLQGFEHVVAPFDGVITARNIDIGTLVNPGTATTTASSATQAAGLFGIARGDVLRIYVNLPQAAFQWATPGTRVTVTVRELPKRKFAGTIFQAAGALNENTRTLQTEIRLPNPDGVLLPGMFADVVFAPPAQAKTLRVPSNVLVIDSHGTRVVVIDDQNRAHYTPVSLGRDYGTSIEILSGIGPSDRLVSDPNDDVKDGGQVNVAPEAKS